METKSKVSKKPSKPIGKRKFHWFRFFTILLAISVGIEIVLGTAGIVVISSMLADEPKVDMDNFYSQETTVIYDRQGNQIADVGAQIRENITYDEVPESLIDAFLSIEDSRYFTHNGFDIPRFTASVINTAMHGKVQGGSTFTMQLIKLTYFTDDSTSTSSNKDIEYKVQQIDLAKQLERKSNKKQIFEMYLNKMNFGGIGNIRGVEKASEQYFGKRVSELNLNESAILAGVVNSPYFYNPYTYLDHATERRDAVLYQMKNHGYITEQQYDLAKSVKVEDLLISPKSSSDSTQYQAYIDYVIKEAQEVSGQDPLNISMEIYTAMDAATQTEMENIEANNYGDFDVFDDKFEMGSIVENNQTGEIVAIGGGRNYTNGGAMLLNHATEQYKQPGSSVKPFLDYVETFDYLGWATDQELVDKAVKYGNWTFQNATGTYWGAVTLQLALSASLNTPAIQTCQALIDKQGVDWYIDYMKKLGFDSDVADKFDISYAIGGNNFICTPEQLTAAHAAIMNGGYYIKPHAITKITFRSGNQTPIEPEYDHNSVISPQAAYMMTTLLNGNVSKDYWHYMQVLQRSYPTFAKTGTTDWGDSGAEYGIPTGAMKDKWMVAETSQFSMSIWCGWEKAEVGGKNYITNYQDGQNTCGKITSRLLDSLEGSYGTPGEVTKPDGVETIKHIKGLFPYVAPTDTTPESYITTGLIKKEFSKLGTYSTAADPLSNLASFKAVMNADGTVTMNWTAYPDSSKLTVATNKDTTFDASWLTGAVVYKARFTQNGTTVGEVSSGSETATQSVKLAYNTETKACGYYGYANTSDESNEVCVTFTTAADPTQNKTETATVVNVAGSVVGVTIGGNATTIDLTGVALTRNGTAIAASSLKQNDVLTITYKDGKIVSVTVA